MGKILNAFVRDELCLEPITTYDSKETQAARKFADKLEDKFSETLSPQQQELYSKLTDAKAEESYLYELDRVIFGYRLGVLMTMEVFTDMDKLFSQKGVTQ